MLNIVITMICVRRIDGEYRFLIQERTNVGISEWIGKWEFPQGRLGDNSLLDFAQFKFNDETSMFLSELLVSKNNWVRIDLDGNLKFYEPFIVTNEHGDLALHFFVRASGIPANTRQAINHKWASVKTLEDLLQTQTVCPLNKEAFKLLVDIEKRDALEALF